MPRYVSRPKALWVEDETYDAQPHIPDLQVSDHIPTDTGLLDRDGNTIWRVNDPIGFRIGDEQ